jgi:hypothetical protein
MITRLRRAAIVLAATMAAAPAFAQGPSQAQRDAVRSACRSDYMANCSSVTPGGKEALECLQQHMSNLSGGCQSAVKAIEASAAPAEEPKQEAAPAAAPAAEPAAKAAAAPSKKPSSAQIAAIKSNCRSDYMKVCAGVPTGGAPALQCLTKHEASLSPSCRKAVAAASGGAGDAPSTASAAPEAAPPAGAAGTTPAAPATIVLRPMRPREVLFVLRSACGADVRTLCAGVPPGGGRIIECLASQASALSPACHDVLGQFAAQ